MRLLDQIGHHFMQPALLAFPHPLPFLRRHTLALVTVPGSMRCPGQALLQDSQPLPVDLMLGPTLTISERHTGIDASVNSSWRVGVRLCIRQVHHA